MAVFYWASGMVTRQLVVGTTELHISLILTTNIIVARFLYL